MVLAPEGSWGDKRETVNGHLVKLQEEVSGIKQSWQDGIGSLRLIG
ncbi:hypothetical protein [Agromyces italicus]|nr:hypothetical protein [Agromyces italicus]